MKSLLFNLKNCPYYNIITTLFISISGKEWMTGKRLFDYIRKQTLPDGTTGRVAFDEMGDRIYAEYQVVNVQSSSKEKRVVVGHYKYSNVSKITEISSIFDKCSILEQTIWPTNLIPYTYSP